MTYFNESIKKKENPLEGEAANGKLEVVTNLATDGLQILAVRMTDAQYIRMGGKSSYILSRSLS